MGDGEGSEPVADGAPMKVFPGREEGEVLVPVDGGFHACLPVLHWFGVPVSVSTLRGY